jgi:hypothetical protein
MVQKDDKGGQPGENGAPNVGGMGIGIRRIGNSVQIRLECGGDYQAIELYERLVESAESGTVVIEMTKR